MGEEVEEQRFVCKFCNKNCSSGKSLGGHMRSHLALIAASKNNKFKADNKIDFEDDLADDCGLEENPCFIGENCSMNLEIDDQDQETHVLRQNPKKSWKITDLRIKSCHTKGNSCRECSKKFISSRALAGHMRTHSILYTKTNKCGHLCSKCGRSFYSIKALFGHMKIHSKIYTVSTDKSDGLSEFEFYHPKKKRSITKYKTFSQESAFVNEIDEADVEAANSLIMLSMGLKEWDGFNSQPESSSNANSSASCDKNITEICADASLCDCCPLISMNFAVECISSESFRSVDKKPDNQTSETLVEAGNCRMAMTDSKVMRSKKHECQICFKIFPSGRALGGHKRAHYNGSIEDSILR